MPLNLPKYDILKHPGAFKVRVRGLTPADLFQNALLAIHEGLRPYFNEANPAKVFNTIKINNAPDLKHLLAEFLDNILFLAATNLELYERANFTAFTENNLEVQLEGCKVYGFNATLQAPPSHELVVQQNDDGLWEAIILFKT